MTERSGLLAKSKKKGNVKEKLTTQLLWTGVIGSVVAAVCCFTPILVVLLGIVGLGAIAGYSDYVLLPTLAVFLGLTAYGVYRQQLARV